MESHYLASSRSLAAGLLSCRRVDCVEDQAPVNAELTAVNITDAIQLEIDRYQADNGMRQPAALQLGKQQMTALHQFRVKYGNTMPLQPLDEPKYNGIPIEEMQDDDHLSAIGDE